MAPNKRSKMKKFFSRRKKRGLPNPSCDSIKTSDVKHLENQQNVSGWEDRGNVRISGAASNHESNLKEARNPENETVSKNRENLWLNGSQRQCQSITYSSQNGFRNASSLKLVQNPNNMTVAYNRRNNWVNNSSVKQRHNLENLTVSDNQESASRMYDFQRHNPNTSFLSQNIYATESLYHPWWRQTLLPLTDASQNRKFSSRYPPSSSANVTAGPLSKVQYFGYKPAPEPRFSRAAFNFPAPAAQPNFTSFSFHSRNPVFKFGDAGLLGNSSMSASERQSIKSRKTAFVRPFPLESTAPGFTRISINAKKDDSPATRNFSSPTFAKNRNLKETTTKKFAVMPTTPNCNSLLKNTISESSSLLEVIDLDKDAKNVDRTSNNENNDDEVIYLFTVDSTKAIVTEIDLNSENVNVSQNIKVTTPVRRFQKRKLSDTAISPSKKFNAGEPEHDHNPLAGDNGAESTANDSLAIKNSPADEPQCCVCNISYSTLASSDETMCAARCGHAFCVPCVRKGVSECRTCGAKCLAFHRLFR